MVTGFSAMIKVQAAATFVSTEFMSEKSSGSPHRQPIRNAGQARQTHPMELAVPSAWTRLYASNSQLGV
jgi:hypothetical protein